jgi:hypothetical protein
MKILALLMIVFGFWVAFEIYQAPTMDQSGKITKPGKKLKDLWQRKKK